MADSTLPEFRYAPRHCSFFRKYVWAIRTKQPDGSWRIVNCLDKDEGCFSVECAFTTSCGIWPYAAEGREASPSPNRPASGG
jgi:hypothetical protein